MDVTIVIPTYNEATTISKLTMGIRSHAPDSEIIIVDDNSPDGTGQIAEHIGKELGNISVIHREGKFGLGSAIACGIAAAKGKIIGVMDADLSHPPLMLPEILKPILSGEADISFGSRRIEGGSVQEWTTDRKLISLAATWMARGLTDLKDPMSGFFFVRRSVLDNLDFKTRGYKIGLEILVKGNYGKAVEVPYVFSNRLHGTSKLDMRQYMLYCRDLLHLYSYKLFSQKNI